jgi:putative membrane protein
MKSLKELLKGRPAKRTYNPPEDLPLDQTSGGAPPYDFPPELIRELANKSEEEVSSLLSRFRTGLSEHRTRLSEHRTDLSEHRTDLSDFRTELSSHRTELSEHRTELSKQRSQLSQHRTELSEHRSALSQLRSDLSRHRTDLSDERSHLANERTHLSYLRTAVSLVTFGTTLNRFAVALAEDPRLAEKEKALSSLYSTEWIGLGMAGLGLALLLWSLYRYQLVSSGIQEGKVVAPRLSMTLFTVGLIAGTITALVMMAI